MKQRSIPRGPESREYLQFCYTEVQTEVIQLVSNGLSNTEIASQLGRNIRSIERTIERVRKHAELRGYDPESDMVHVQSLPVKGTSTLYDDDGKVRLQWVKTNRSTEELAEIMREIADGYTDNLPKAKPVKDVGDLGSGGDSHLLNLHILTDAHIGMMACAEETLDENFDLREATLLFKKWMDYSLRVSPDAEVGVLLNMGDFFHYDGLEAVTPTNRHLLDTDTRFFKVVRLGIYLTRYMIQSMLHKYKEVRFVMCDANHDPATGVMLSEFFKMHYGDEPRVTVDNNPSTYKALQWGKTMICAHHGHKRSIEKGLDSVFASKFSQMFGDTEWRYCHTGHFHHKASKESALMLMEQHRTLIPKDAYASNGGWESKRGSECITYHKTWGEVGRVTINHQMLSGSGDGNEGK